MGSSVRKHKHHCLGLVESIEYPFSDISPRSEGCYEHWPSQMKEYIDKLFKATSKEREKPNSYSFLPEILESLKKIAESCEEPRECRVKIAAALERLVLEDFNFSESQLGGEILRFAEQFVK